MDCYDIELMKVDNPHPLNLHHRSIPQLSRKQPELLPAVTGTARHKFC